MNDACPDKTNENDTVRDCAEIVECKESSDGESRTAEETRPRKAEKRRIFTTRNLTRIAILSGLAAVLYSVGFAVPVFAPWLEFQFSDIPALLGGFMMGPVAGSVIIAVKCIVKVLLTRPTTTMFVGELGDILMGLAFVLPASLIYRRHRSKKGALAGLSVGLSCNVVMAIVTNLTMLIPLYSVAYGWDMIIGGMAAIFKGATRETFYFYYLLLSVLPFNLLRGAVSAGLTFLLYKRLQKLFDIMVPAKKRPKAQTSGTTEDKTL